VKSRRAIERSKEPAVLLPTGTQFQPQRNDGHGSNKKARRTCAGGHVDDGHEADLSDQLMQPATSPRTEERVIIDQWRDG
jgi:hypothetical protein